MYEVTHKRIVRSKTNHPEYRQDANPDDLEPEVVEAGETFEPTEDELAAFGDRLREVRTVEEEPDEEAEEGNA